MSKSKGNYVGIAEAPAEMFKKLMSISDVLMYRYYELLTDRSLAQIAALKSSVTRRCVASEAGQDLTSRARSSATFHSAAAADRAADEWQRVVASGEVPSDIEQVRIEEASIRVDKFDRENRGWRNPSPRPRGRSRRVRLR